jgi:hypothetical protein
MIVLELAQEIETEEHSQKSRLRGEKRSQTEVIGRQFVNATLRGRSAILIAPDFQGCIGARRILHLASLLQLDYPFGTGLYRLAIYRTYLCTLDRSFEP